ncbi:MAG TPA: carboxypeptidase-like regulatory domain-containing protein, partial [Bacteroidales bacterium]|nr:carboxypeptidase-like regulatory domain-containing protein [Bacteroidales bacterium]
MRKLILLLFFISFDIIVFGQVIKGTILESETNNPVRFATIYFNKTFFGTSSDENGNFELSILKNTTMPLTISAIGYYSVTIENFSKKDHLNIYLKPKIYIIKDVIVNAKSLKR